jgi:hypothetical protein
VDWAQGYGFQMWRGRHNSVRLDGLGGQLVILLPDQDAVIVFTANAEQSKQKEMDLAWDYLLPAMKDVRSLPADEASNRALAARLASLQLPVPSSPAANAALVSKITGHTFQFDPNRLGIDSVSFTFGEQGAGELVVTRSGSRAAVKMGNGFWQASNINVNNLLRPTTPSKSRDANYLVPGTPYRVAATFAWSAPNTLAVTTRFVEESIGAETILFNFAEEAGTFRVSIDQPQAGGGPGGPAGQTQNAVTGRMVTTGRP